MRDRTATKTLMAFLPYSGKVQVEYFPKKASTAFTANCAVAFYTALGQVAPSATTSLQMAGVCLRTVASTDADYASATGVPCIMLTPDTVFIADVTAGTLAAASVGNRFDLADSVSVTQAGTTYKVVTCVGYISATKGLFKFNSAYEFKNA